MGWLHVTHRGWWWSCLWYCPSGSFLCLSMVWFKLLTHFKEIKHRYLLCECVKYHKSTTKLEYNCPYKVTNCHICHTCFQSPEHSGRASVFSSEGSGFESHQGQILFPFSSLPRAITLWVSLYHFNFPSISICFTSATWPPFLVLCVQYNTF